MSDSRTAWIRCSPPTWQPPDHAKADGRHNANCPGPASQPSAERYAPQHYSPIGIGQSPVRNRLNRNNSRLTPKQHPPFHGIEEPDLLALVSAVGVKFHESDEFLCWQDTPYAPFVFVIQQGAVRGRFGLGRATPAVLSGDRMRRIVKEHFDAFAFWLILRRGRLSYQVLRAPRAMYLTPMARAGRS